MQHSSTQAAKSRHTAAACKQYSTRTASLWRAAAFFRLLLIITQSWSTHTHTPLASPLFLSSGIGKKLADFKTALKAQEWPAITQLRGDVEAFASQFPTIGFEEESMRYK